jgi:uridine monophosphate synthetase
MALKKSNLCLSADVSTAKQLLLLADLIGPSIVVLKTHYDLINNWDYSPTTGTGAKLARLARRHGFLIFEDRKFGDIGNTVQLQYTEGTAKIIEWSHITNVNMVPGKAAVDALADAAKAWRERKRYEVKTDISVGTPRPESLDSDGDDDRFGAPISEDSNLSASCQGRKASIVSITTVSQHFEPANSPRSHEEFGEEVLPGIEEAPMERGLLILAQMSSVGNFMTGAYTQACVESAREHKDFVMGFIAQESLNTELEDQFINMTPGCQLPPPTADEDAEVQGDGKGQQYNTPSKIIGLMGNDIVIVGRGIIKAEDPAKEAARYRQKAWEAYENRIAA